MFGYRPDGKKVKDLDPITKIVPHIMSARHDSQNLAKYNVPCEAMDTYIREQAEKGEQYTYMQILIAAAARVFTMYPKANRFVMNGRIFQHNDIRISFVVKKSLDKDAPESLVKIKCSGQDTLADVRGKVNAVIAENGKMEANNGTEKLARLLTFTPNFLIKFLVGSIKFLDKHGMLPMAILNLSPFHTSIFITNMKSIKGPAIYHHLYDFGTTGLFLAMGKGTRGPKKTMPLQIVMDERFCDGFYWVTCLRQLLVFLNDPSLLERPLTDQSGNL